MTPEDKPLQTGALSKDDPALADALAAAYAKGRADAFALAREGALEGAREGTSDLAARLDAERREKRRRGDCERYRRKLEKLARKDAEEAAGTSLAGLCLTLVDYIRSLLKRPRSGPDVEETLARNGQACRCSRPAHRGHSHRSHGSRSPLEGESRCARSGRA